MIAVRNDDGRCFFAASRINDAPRLLRLADETLCGSRIASDDGNYMLAGHHVIVSDIHKCHIRASLKILDLFADLFDRALNVNDKIRDLRILRFGADRVRFAVDLLNEEVKLSADGVSRRNDISERGDM